MPIAGQPPFWLQGGKELALTGTIQGRTEVLGFTGGAYKNVRVVAADGGPGAPHGKIVGLAERSMVVHEPLAFWETWSKQHFQASGNYALEGAIAPVKIDVDQRIGTYEEPNVWVAYPA